MSLVKYPYNWVITVSLSILLVGCSTFSQPNSQTNEAKEVPAQTHQTQSTSKDQQVKKNNKVKPEKPVTPPKADTPDKKPQPSQIYLDPDPSAGSARPMPGMAIQLQVNDLRSQRYLLSIHRPNKEQAKLISSSNNVRQAIYKAIKKNLQDRSIKISDYAPNRLSIDIVSLRSKATQNTLSYVAIDQVILKATFTTKNKKVVRQYTASRRTTGNLQVDIGQQQVTLNHTLNAVLTGLLTDHKLLDKDPS